MKAITSKKKLIGIFVAILSLNGLSTVSPSNAVGTWTWTDRTSAGARNWHSIASSADGSRLYAGVGNNGGVTGALYTSTDYGVSWTALTSAGTRSWFSIATNIDGTKIAAVDKEPTSGSGGYIYTSTDSGVTWTGRTSAGKQYWNSIASSSDGTKLVAITTALIYTSTDSGATWTQITNPGVTFNAKETLFSVKSSDDGSHLALSTKGGIYVSSDSGATWSMRTPTLPSSWSFAADSQPQFQSIATSSDGSHLVTGTRTAGGDPHNAGIIFTSSDFGATWTNQGQANLDYISFVSNGDGTKLAAAIYSNRLVATSGNSGTTWTNQSTGGLGMLALASNIDGSLLFAGSYGGDLYTGIIPSARIVAAPPASTSISVPSTASTPAAVLTLATATTTSAGVTITPIANPATGSLTPFDANTASIFDVSVVGITGQVTVCVAGGPSINLWHYTAGAWVDVTTSHTATQTCGLTSSFSPFASGASLVVQSTTSTNSAAQSAADAAAKAQQDHDNALVLGTLAAAIGSVEQGLSTLTLSAIKRKQSATSSLPKKSKLKKLTQKK